MRQSQFLHQLVHALDEEERARFLKTLKKGKLGDNSLYLKLFMAIDAQDDYNEPAIRSGFEGTSFGKSLGFPKSHLYDRLLSHLGSVQWDKTAAMRFRAGLAKIELLADKGLADQALRLIEKELKRAEAMEDVFTVLQLLRLRRRQVLQLQGHLLFQGHSLLQEVAEINLAEQEWEAALQLELKAVRLHDMLSAWVQGMGSCVGAEVEARLKAVHEELKSLLADSKLRFHAKVMSLRALACYHQLLEDFSAVHDAYLTEIMVWEAHPLQVAEAPIRHVRLLCDWLTSKALSGKDADLLQEIDRLRMWEVERRGSSEPTPLRSRLRVGMAEVFQTTYSLELGHHLYAGRTRMALRLVPAILEGLAAFDRQLSDGGKLGFYYQLAVVKWLSGQPSSALKWVRRILQFEKGEVCKEIREFAPLLEKVLHYELGNIGLLESWFRALRYRRRKEVLGKGLVSGLVSEGKGAAGGGVVSGLVSEGKGVAGGGVVAGGTLVAERTLETILEELLRGLLGELEPGGRVQHFRDFLVGLDGYLVAPGASRVGVWELGVWAKKGLGARF